MSRLCRLEARDKGVFVLTLGSVGSHNYLTNDTIVDLLVNLDKVRDNAEVKGLVITCESETGTFCDGLKYDNLSEFEVQGLVERFAMVICWLLELPIPTVAAVRGRATSLGQALVLAHDHCIVWEDAVFGLPEAQFGYPLPGYLTTLLREKLERKFPHRWPRHSTESDREEVLKQAINWLHRVMVFHGTSLAMNRKMECPDTFAAVEVATNGVPRAMPPGMWIGVEEEGSRTTGSRLMPFGFAPPRAPQSVEEEGSRTIGSRLMPFGFAPPRAPQRFSPAPSPTETYKFDG